MSKIAFENVDEYLKPFPEKQRVALEKLRQTIKAAAPKAEEYIGYQMPAYKYLGPLVYFGGFTNHSSFFAGKKIIDTFKKELEGYKTSAGTIQFTDEKPLPASLVKKIVKIRVQENEEKVAAKSNKRSIKTKTKK